jgi:hypothetical protein
MTMARHSKEYSAFNTAMDTLLRANPAAVKADIERKQRELAAERIAKGERKRGRKKAASRPPSVSGHALGDLD